MTIHFAQINDIVFFSSPKKSFFGIIKSELQHKYFCEFGYVDSYKYYDVELEDGSIVECSPKFLSHSRHCKPLFAIKRTLKEQLRFESLKASFNINSCLV